MKNPSVSIREARTEDAPVLVAAEKETAGRPGLLVSRPYELKLKAFEQKIVELRKIGRYVVAERGGKIVGHAFLDPLPLEAISHVFRLTIVVHPDFTSQGVGTALMIDLMDWGEAQFPCRKDRTTGPRNERARDSPILEARLCRRRTNEKSSTPA